MKKLVKFSLKGGALPNGFEVELKVEFDYTGCPIEELIKRVTSGQSDRVKLQSKYRKLPTSMLRAMSDGLTKVRWDEIAEASELSLKDRMMALDKDNFVELMVTSYGISEDEATAIYNRKHDVVEENEDEPITYNINSKHDIVDENEDEDEE